MRQKQKRPPAGLNGGAGAVVWARAEQDLHTDRPADLQLLTPLLDGLAHLAERRPRRSASRLHLRHAVAELADAIAALRRETMQ